MNFLHSFYSVSRQSIDWMEIPNLPGTILVQKKRKSFKQDSTTACNLIPSYLFIFLHLKKNYLNSTADFVERKFKIFLLVPSCSKCVKVLHYKMSKLKKTFQTFPFNFSVIFQLIQKHLFYTNILLQNVQNVQN